MLKVFISPNKEQIADDNGVGKVVHAQFDYLPQFGIELVSHPEEADVIASHVYGDYLPRLDVLHLHGLYFQGDIPGKYAPQHLEANARIVESCRRARYITMPSRWAGECLRRDMRIEPVTIPNGVDLELWQGDAIQAGGQYALWNKNRAGDVCDPTPAYELARLGNVPVISTFAPDGVGPLQMPPSLRVVGKQPFSQMQKLIGSAGVYLATTREVFSLSVLEAMAAGVPILGYEWGGTVEAVRHKVEGYLVRPGDIRGLIEGYQWLMANRAQVSENCRARAKSYEWRAIIGQYAELYHKAFEERKAQQYRVAVVITNYNYGRYVNQAIASCLNQSRVPDEIIVVDDSSSDDSHAVLEGYRVDENSKVKVIYNALNLGVAQSRNRGIRAADAQYIICLDADDYLHPDYVATLLPALRGDPTLGVVWSKLALVNEAGQPTGDIWDFNFKWEEQAHPDPKTGGIRNGIPAGAMFCKAMWERAGGYRQPYHPAEDAEFWLRGLSTGFKARRVTDEPLFMYRRHDASASVTKQTPPIHQWHPWSVDSKYPMAAPATKQSAIRGYADPLVTVVIPVGPGHHKYVAMALESLLAQSFRAWAAIVVNDSGEDLSEVLRPYPFARVLEPAKKGGQGASRARNAALSQVTTSLVLWLDGDDYLLPGALEKMVRAYVAQGGSKYIYTDYLAVNAEGKITQQSVADYSQEGWLDNGLHAVTVLMETAQARAVGGFDEKLSGWEDWDFFIKCAIKGFCGHHLKEPLFAYRVATGQRREESQRNRAVLLAAFKERYGQYFGQGQGQGQGQEGIGVSAMAKSKCCGGNGDVVLEAKGLLSDSVSATLAASGTQPVQLVYTGPAIAPVPYAGVAGSGRQYQAGNNDFDRYVTAHPDDVAKLLATGKFELAQAQVNSEVA